MTTLLNASGISFSYGDTPVLCDLFLKLEMGEILAFLGPNGSGKSTLIKVLLGLLRAKGEISWEQRSLRHWKRRELARRLAYLPQSPMWEPHHTVLDVLRMGRAPYWSAFGVESSGDAKVIRETADLLGLSDLLSRRLDQISGGQRQRAFIGRCLVQQPRALLLDEPNTYLDLRHQVEIGQLLHRLAREKSLGVLMTSHDLNIAGMFADRLMLLHEGRIIAGGKPEQVLDPMILGRAYGIPMQRVANPAGPPLAVPVLPQAQAR
mgnify:CR=1 FL=1